MLPKKIAFVDLETTGARSSYDRIIEVGIVRVEDDQITQTYHTLLDPQTHLPPQIEMLTGITVQDLEGKPTFREVANDIREILADCVFVAHNVRFDYGFLKHEFMRHNISYTAKHFCTVKLSRALFPTFTHHNLDAIIERFGIQCSQRHRAFEDAKVLFEFYKKVQTQFPEETFQQALNHALRRPSIPIKLKQEDLDNLPEEPGVYIFYGEGGMPLYVGKSKCIRDRVLSHFSGDLRSPTEMNIAQQVESIETIVTAGELGALFLESKLIKKLLPLYNKMLRIKHELIGLRKVINTDGYETVQLESLKFIDPLQLDSFLGFFRSKKQAKEFLADIAKEFSLCEKLLGLEKTDTSCFAYRLERCKGACTGQEKSLMYNLRFTTAFYKTKIKPWPFTKPIFIKERNEFTGITEHFLIDKWCYLGSIKTDDKNSEKSQLESDYIFDMDMYKILVRFFNKADNLKLIRECSDEEIQLPHTMTV